MAGVPVTLRAEVAAIEVPIEQILSLGPGSLIRLGTQADQGITVFAENVKLARAQPGAQRRPARDPGIRYREEVRMSQQHDITPREALMRLGASTAEAIAKVLENFTPGAVERGEVTVLEDGASPFANVARGSIASSVSYVNGVTGANIFVLTPAGARLLASAMGAPVEEAQDGADAPPLSELELSAIVRGRQPDDGRGSRRDRRRARPGDRDLDARHARARRARLGRRHLRHRARTRPRRRS